MLLRAVKLSSIWLEIRAHQVKRLDLCAAWRTNFLILQLGIYSKRHARIPCNHVHTVETTDRPTRKGKAKVGLVVVVILPSLSLSL